MSRSQTTAAAYVEHPKISSRHQERLAYIYVRQSTLRQVQQNQESQAYQYRLQQRAVELGWVEERIRIIDSDLGMSAQNATAREGFQALVAEVSFGWVGIVFGYEVSRLARNNYDWYHLLDLAAMFDTLIADCDGVYDPGLYNDRLLLGLKGTMSEAELHMLRQRLDAGRMNQVRRGTYRQLLPTGYLRLRDGTVVKDPDDQVRHVIGLVFDRFSELGSINKVLRYLRENKVLLPRRQSAGPQAGQMVWKVASESAVNSMLRNPAYAGAFAYGRKQIDPTRRKPSYPATGRIRKPMSEWLHLQQGVYPAYINWEQYLANQERLQQNGLRFVMNRQKAQGIVRKGPGLLQGMVVCGHCGHHLQVVYKHTPRYVCRGVARTTEAPSTCTSIRAPVLDQMVVKAFFEAIQPAQIDALEAILASQRIEREQLERHWQEKLKRVRYAAQLAQRQYDAVDPDNRLVAAELERRWEAELRQLREVEEDYHTFQRTPMPDGVPPQLRDLFSDVSRRLPELWPKLSNAQKKELLRSLISHVIVKRPVPDRIEARIVWTSSHYSDHAAITSVHSEQDVSGHDEMVARIRELYQQGYSDAQMAAKLTEEGFHSARSPYVTSDSVMKIRLARKWYLPLAQMRQVEEVDGFLTIRGLAKRLGLNRSSISRYIYKGIIAPSDVTRDPASGIWLIHNDPELIDRLRKRIAEQKNRTSKPTVE